jgi:hypothetical protein
MSMYMYIYMYMYSVCVSICRYIYIIYMYIYSSVFRTYIYTENGTNGKNGNFRLFATNENGKRKIVFLGR